MSKTTPKKAKLKKLTSSVRRRLLLTLGCGIMVLMLAIGASVYLLLNRVENNLWESRRVDASRNASLVIASYMGTVSRSLDMLGMYEVATLVQENGDFLPTWLSDNLEFREVVLFDGDGHIIGAATRGAPVLANVAEMQQSDWYINAKAGQPTMSPVRLSAENAPYIIMARPADNGGVVASRLAMDVLWEIVADAKFGETGRALIVERNGTVVGHSDVSVVLNGTTLANRTEWTQIAGADNMAWSGQFTNFQNRPVVARSERIPNTDWIIITELDRTEAQAMARLAIGGLAIGTVTIGVLALMTMAHLMNIQIIKPLDQLRLRARRIAQGEFKQIKIEQYDELGEVSQAFNDMIFALEQRDQRIATQNKSLTEEVAERKQAQESLQLVNVELVEASQIKDQFLATMSHELRTPLNAILGMTEALTVPVYGALNDQQFKAIRHVQDSGRHLRTLIDDMLDLSKMTAGRSPLNFVAVDMAEIVESSVRMVRPILNAKKLIFQKHADRRVNYLMADERRLKQIVVNLLNNACKFTQDGGKVQLEIKGDPEQGMFQIIVSDTGSGIPAKSLKNIFEPFVQIESEALRDSGGVGLGLSVVNRIVELHGGDINVASEVGRGSRFMVELPWREARRSQLQSTMRNHGSQAHANTKTTAQIAGTKPAKQGISDHSAGRTLLLVDDREANILTLIDYLQVKGLKVIVARSGEESLQLAQQLRPDVILMDIHMPKMSGIEAIGHLRNIATTRAIPIIALTALAMPGDRERCINAGADDYITKPISLRELLVKIDAQLSRPQHLVAA